MYKEKKRAQDRALRDALRYYCNRKHFVFLLDNTCRCVTTVCVSSFLFLLLQSFFQLTTVTLQPEYNCKLHLSVYLSVFVIVSVYLSAYQLVYLSV